MNKSGRIVCFQGEGPFLLLAICLLLLSSHSVQAQSSQNLEAKLDSSIVKIDEDHYQVGNVQVDKRSREITIPGRVNMNDGPIEYFAVTPGGKTHESVLVLDVQPLHLQLALLLFGLDYGHNLSFQGDSAMPMGDRVKIEVSWTDLKGKQVRRPASTLIKDLQANKSMGPTDWVFTGSVMNQGNFMADMDGSIIAVYNDPVAILNNPLEGRVDDTVYGSNKDTVPQPGTKITMIVKALQKQK